MHLDGHTVAAHGGGLGRHLAERLHGALGAELLDHAKDGVEGNDHEDGDRVGHLAEYAGDHGGTEQEQDQEVLKLVEDHRGNRALLTLGQLVGPHRFLTAGHLGGGEPVGRAAEMRQDVLGRDGVRGLDHECAIDGRGIERSAL